MAEWGGRQRHRFVIPIPPTYEMPLPARGAPPKYNPNVQRLRDIQAVSNYERTLDEINEAARARGGYEYYDDDPLDLINWAPGMDDLIKPDDYYLPHPATGNPIYQGAKRGRGGSGGGDKRASGSSPFGGGRSGAAGTKKRFTVTQEIV